jgi:hypothetical protein
MRCLIICVSLGLSGCSHTVWMRLDAETPQPVLFRLSPEIGEDVVDLAAPQPLKTALLNFLEDSGITLTITY